MSSHLNPDSQNTRAPIPGVSASGLRDHPDIHAELRKFSDLFPDDNLEVWIRSLAEEAGEVVGAFNKWHDGRKTKPGTLEDVVEELVQLQAVVMLVAANLGVHQVRLTDDAARFLAAKRQEILAVREQSQR